MKNERLKYDRIDDDLSINLSEVKAYDKRGHYHKEGYNIILLLDNKIYGIGYFHINVGKIYCNIPVSRDQFIKFLEKYKELIENYISKKFNLYSANFLIQYFHFLDNTTLERFSRKYFKNKREFWLNLIYRSHWAIWESNINRWFNIDTPLSPRTRASILTNFPEIESFLLVK